MSNSERLGELRRDIRELQETLYLLSLVTKDKTGGSPAEWVRFHELIRRVGERVEDVNRESRYMLRQRR